MMIDIGSERDSLGLFKGHRVASKQILMALVIGFVIIMPISSAETLKVISNTDRCIYQPGMDKDYCKTVYELCDPTLNMNKVDFRFKTENDKSLKISIDDLSYFYSSKAAKTNCREITIEGYKNPYKNVDNVLCYGSNCHEEYAWWNSSFIFKFPIIASTTSGQITFPLLVNDSAVVINDFPQYIWCNYSVNTTRSVVGYLYFTNESFYRCIDPTETFPVFMNIDEGNETGIGNPEKELLLWWHAKETVDESIYEIAMSDNGCNRIAGGKIGAGFNCDRGDTDWMEFADSKFYDSIDAQEAYSWCIWMNPTSWNTGGANDQIASCEGATYPFVVRRSINDAFITWIINTDGGDESVVTGSLPATGSWFHLCGTLGGVNQKIFLNGHLVATNTYNLGDMTAWNSVKIGCRDEGDRCIDGVVDEFMLWNRTLSDDEIMARYNNSVGGQNFAPVGSILNFSLNVSVSHFDSEVPSFLITSQQYQTILNDTFTLLNPIELILKGSGGARKQAGGAATSLISARLIFNNNTLYDETIISIRGTNERAVFTLPIANVTGTGGVNNLIFQMKRTGNDDMNISNLLFHTDTTLDNNDIAITNSLDSIVVNYTSTTFLNIGNFTINTGTDSVVLVDVVHTFESTSNIIVADCFLESQQTGERTLTYSRWLQSSGDVGSSGTNYRSQIPFNGPQTWMLFCRSSTNNLILNNATVYIMNQQNDDNQTIQGFQNDSSISGITGSGNVLLSTDYRNAEGPQLEILTTIIMQSTSGSQEGSNSPVFRIRTNDSVCNSSLQRSLASNSDIGTAKVYLNCGNLVPGTNNNYEVVVDVAGGETLDVLNVSMSTYETTPQLVIPGIIPPIVVITSPLNGSNLTETVILESVVIDLSRTGWSSIINVLNFSGVLVLNVLNETTFENTTTTTLNTRVIDNGDYIIEWIVSNNEGNNTDNVTISLFNIEIPAPPSITFCANDQLLLQRESAMTSINGNVTIEIVDELIYCNYGCNNWTLLQFGNPGCIEGDYILSIMFIILLIIFILILRGAVK